MTRKDWTVVVVDAAKPRTLTPIQLQKALFILGKKMPEAVKPDFYEFIPYNFGPFSKDIYSDAARLRDEGLIDEISRPGQNWPEYGISVNGSGRAASLRQGIAPATQQYLDRLVAWVESQSFQTLLRAVYREYPEFAQNSVFNVAA